MTQSTDEHPRKRVRLSPAVRIEQILDAALVEFSDHGFGAARMENIARRVGMSKAGLYAHFSGKEAIFEALLETLLAPDFPNEVWRRQDGRSLEQVVDEYMDEIYCTITDPKAQTVLRLVISESGRVPQLMQKWRNDLLRHLEEQQCIINECTANGSLRASALTDCFAIAFSPALYCAIWQLIYADSDCKLELNAIRTAHRQLMLDSLRPLLGDKPGQD
ncbi:TetR/AcrR family transcriptional regulator [Kerstersia sp.]|uniref:TetR/AcrR family transcriptional regulator n=1 Tax=Kerstersia sp. TaxID=1930783 RepID=UPI003F8F1BA0